MFRSDLCRSTQEKMSSTLSGDETAQFFGFLDAAAALVFSYNYPNLQIYGQNTNFITSFSNYGNCFVGKGAAYGTAKSGVGVASMAGVLGICGLIIAVIVSIGINAKAMLYYLFDGCGHLSSGLACGPAAGMAIGILGDAGVSPQHMGEYLCPTALFSSLRKMSVPIRR